VARECHQCACLLWTGIRDNFILRLFPHKVKLGNCKSQEGSCQRVSVTYASWTNVVVTPDARLVRACGLQVSCSEQDELRPMTVRCFGWDRPVGEGDVDRDPYQVSKPTNLTQHTCNGSVSIVVLTAC
jgi:hypothetical protein